MEPDDLFNTVVYLVLSSITLALILVAVASTDSLGLPDIEWGLAFVIPISMIVAAGKIYEWIFGW